MDEAYFKEFEDSIFIIESRTALKRNIVKAVLIDLGLLFAYGMFTFWIPFEFKNSFTTFIYIAVSLALGAVLLYFLIKREKRKYDDLIEQFNEMGSSYFSELCNQALNAYLKYNTFCLLDDYIFIPGDMLLISYSNINEVQTIYHSTNFIYDGARFVIYTFAGKSFSIRVKQFRAFKREYDDFIFLLNEKRSLSLQKASV